MRAKTQRHLFPPSRTSLSKRPDRSIPLALALADSLLLCVLQEPLPDPGVSHIKALLSRLEVSLQRRSTHAIASSLLTQQCWFLVASYNHPNCKLFFHEHDGKKGQRQSCFCICVVGCVAILCWCWANLPLQLYLHVYGNKVRLRCLSDPIPLCPSAGRVVSAGVRRYGP